MTMKITPSATATLLLTATFLGGLLAGVLIERTVFASVPDAHAAVRPPADRPSGHADRGRIALELDLTEDQREDVDRILAEQQRQVREILSETRPRTRAVLRETHRQIEAILTPEQQERWRALIREHRRDDKPGREE
jgi:Spy/CpxP family protein refolding chaperone